MDPYSYVTNNIQWIHFLMFALYHQAPENKEAQISCLKEWLEDSVTGSDPTLRLIAGIIFMHDQDYAEALKHTNAGGTMELHALNVQIYLKMCRSDCAEKQLEIMQQIDEDHTLTRLANAWFNLAVGGSKIQEAYIIYQDFSEIYAVTGLVLNGKAVCCMHMGNFDEAESLLLDALTKARCKGPRYSGQFGCVQPALGQTFFWLPQDGDPMLTDRVWEAFVKSFVSQMKSAFTASSFVKEIFTTGYPKLYSIIENLLERISRDTDVKGVLPAISSDGKEQMFAAIETFQTAFLAQCFTHLSDLITSVFPMSSRGSVPSKEQISKIIFQIQEEIEAVQFDGHLMLLVLRQIGKVLLLLTQRAEYQISTGPEARQISAAATPSQLKNFALCQHLQDIHTRVSALLTTLPPQASEVLSPALGSIYGVACDSVTSLFQSMLERLESCARRRQGDYSSIEKTEK